MLGKQVYNIPELLFDYKGVKVPPLGMVDEIITVTNVEQTKTTMNKLINTFIEHKNLNLSQEKSYRINIGKGHLNCPKLQVHENEMNEADAEKYLGDVIDKSCKIQAAINKRLKRGEGIISEILSILSEISLGKYKTEAALKLREAMLLIGVLYNSEAWHGLTSAQVVIMEQLDESFLRGILNAHRKTAKEFLYPETENRPIKYFLAQRRNNYLKHILSRDENELSKKIHLAQQNQQLVICDPCKKRFGYVGNFI